MLNDDDRESVIPKLKKMQSSSNARNCRTVAATLFACVHRFMKSSGKSKDWSLALPIALICFWSLESLPAPIVGGMTILHNLNISTKV